MKKKIALFANGWNNEFLSMNMEGIKKCSSEENIDLFLFLNYASYNEPEEMQTGEFNIYNLPDIKDFDGVIMFSNIFNSESVLEKVRKKVVESGVPAISFERQLDGISYIGTDNYSGMFELVKHLVKVHGVKDIVCWGGPEENDESNERLRAIKDVVENNDLFLPEENIYHGAWGFSDAADFARDYLKSGRPLPDAFICANDFSALGIMSVLKEKGYSIPKDVIVTGFDNIGEAAVYDPTLTTVERRWETLGYRGCLHLLVKIERKKTVFSEKLPSSLKLGESCGCIKSCDSINIIRKHCCDEYVKSMNSVVLDWTINDLENEMGTATSVAQLTQKMNDFYRNTKFMSDELYIVCDEGFADFKDINREYERNIEESGYGKKMIVVFAAKNGRPVEIPDFYTKDMVPGYDADDADNKMYMFLPLHYKGYKFGYMIIRDALELIENKMLYKWMSRFNEALGRFRQNRKLVLLNQKLNDLYIRDSMTGLFNRFGLEKIVKPMIAQMSEKKQSGAVIFADINYLKKINDKYGHLQGDLAIRIMADILKPVESEAYVPVRYGGDEFLIIGKFETAAEVCSMIKKIEDDLYSLVNTMVLPFKMSVSFGSYFFDSPKPQEFDNYLGLADEAMYANKSRLHEKIRDI